MASNPVHFVEERRNLFGRVAKAAFWVVLAHLAALLFLAAVFL